MPSTKTIQLLLPESLLRQIDKECGTRNRSAFLCRIVEEWFRNRKIKELEQKQIDGYKNHPIQSGEFALGVEDQ